VVVEERIIFGYYQCSRSTSKSRSAQGIVVGEAKLRILQRRHFVGAKAKRSKELEESKRKIRKYLVKSTELLAKLRLLWGSVDSNSEWVSSIVGMGLANHH
jgi:hypothetical protein